MDLNSPFIVPLGAFLMVLGIVAVNSLHRFHVRKLQSEERLAAIAKGLPVPPEPAESELYGPSDPQRSAARTRRSGIILVAVGLGIILGLALITWLVQRREVLAATIGGLIPLFIGLGMLLDYSMQLRDIAAQGGSSSPRLNSASPDRG